MPPPVFHFFLIIIIAGICDATDYNILDSEMGRKHELWMAEHGREYKDEAEKARRFEIFKENVKYIEDFNNAGNHKYTLGVNLFSDLTTEEFLATYACGFKRPKPEVEWSLRSVKYERTIEPQNISSIPSRCDWRDAGAVTPVKFQGNCSGCWAFTAAATVESLVKIKTGVLHNLSPQHLIDCDRFSLGCKGGWVHKAYSYIISNGGITTEANYPYKDCQGNCDHAKEKQTVASIRNYRQVHRRSEHDLMKAVAQQPVGVSLEASKDFQSYKSGIFHGSCGTNSNHAVTVVGYGETGKDKYWIIKNSWSSKWGEGGYIRMEKDVASSAGLCGIAMWAYYPTM